jgi:hypothetical protein
MIVVLVVTLFLWIVLAGFSYLFVNKAIISMLLPAHPEYDVLLGWVDLANQYRHWLWAVFAVLIVLLTLFQLWWYRKQKNGYVSKKIWIFIALIELMAVLSYPLISDDIYSYLYSGKMVMEYRVNPYTVMPKEFLGRDLWLFFVKNIDNVYYHIGNTGITYYYGPLFLMYTVIFVGLVGGGRFIALYLGWKLLNWIWFMLAGWVLYKLVKDKHKVIVWWYLNPLLQFELLVNNHNDLMMIGLFWLALWLSSRNTVSKWLTYLASLLIKFVTIVGLPMMFFDGKRRENIAFLLGVIVVLFHALKPLHAWYYSWVYLFWPFAVLRKRTWVIFFIFQMLMLLNYSGYVWFNRWTGAPFLPDIRIIRWVLVGLILFSEKERIFKTYLLKYKYFMPK